MRVVKPKVPIETQGRINRMQADLDGATGANGPVPFEAERTYQTGEAISHAGRIYIADAVIVTGETVKPGENAVETSIEDIVNALNALNGKGE